MTSEFERRFARHRDELEWLFMELYDDRDALHRFEAMMREAWMCREEELRALDRAREADPLWYRGAGMLGMTMYTELFAGSLRGVMERLPYLRELGVTYLHLMPLLKMPHPQNDGGYAVEDFDAVDPALGTNEDLIALTRALREAGISLCLDFVMNRTADTHAWAMRAKAGDAQAQAYFF